MVKIKKFVSLFSVILIILSNLAFAQDDSSSYEGRPIDPSREGIDYHREGSVIVYPAQTSSNEMKMMERFNRGEFSEEEMRKMAREKFGDDFDEMEFKKSMMEFKERAERKDSFSYENEGYQGYYHSPSYEGYSKEHMIFGMLFEHIGEDIDPRDIKQNCNEPDKIADMVIGKLKEKIGDFQSVCKRIDEQDLQCEEHSKKGCSQIGAAFVREGATEIEKLNAIAYSCPPNKDAIVDACKKRNRLHMEQRLNNLDEECRKRFDYEGERLVRECERFRQNQICDKEKYMERCMGGMKKNEEKSGGGHGFMSARWECYDGNVESHTDSSCRSHEEWNDKAGSSCQNRCSKETGKCGVNSLSVSGECGGQSRVICPAYPVPACGDGKNLRESKDSNGCIYYYCQASAGTGCTMPRCDGAYDTGRKDSNGCAVYECPSSECNSDADCKKGVCPDGYSYPQYSCYNNKCSGVINYVIDPCLEHTITTCPESIKPVCAQNQVIKTKTDDKGCVYYFCETASTACPEIQAPSCAAGTHLEKNVDEKGCVYYYCKQDECTSVSKPTCASGERLESYYDNRGCVTSYQCIKYETACPAVTKPACVDGQSTTTRYDNKGCVVGYECVSVASSNGSSITGAAVLSNYDDLLRHCENSWNEQQRICLNTPQACDKEDFIEKCRDQERKHSSDLNAEIERNCQSSTESEVRHAEERCSRIDDERARCLEHSAKRCEQMKGNAEKCKELMTEERVRKFIVEEVTKRCKFKDILDNEEDVKRTDKAEIILAVLNTATEGDIEKLNLFIDDLKEDLKLQDTTIYKGMINPNSFGDIKLLPFVVNAKISAARSSERAKEVKEGIVASSKVEEAASKLASLRDSDVPAEYLYIIEDKASEVLDASDELEDIEKKEEEKGIGYKIKLFLGLAKAAEQEEIKQLEESNSKLQNSIDALTKLTEEVPNDVAKSILKEQVENLKKQKEDTQVLIETKEKKAKGWFGVFG